MSRAADDLGDEQSRSTVRAAARPTTAPDTRPTDGRAKDTRSRDGAPRTAEPRPAAPAAPDRPPAQPRVAPTPVLEHRRYRQTIHRVDLWTVLKMSVCFYICAMAVTMVALVALWVIGDAAGVIHSVESFLGDLLQTKNFTFLDGEILRGALLVGAVLVVLEIVLTVIAAAFYNLFAELFGGIEITISEDESAL